MRPDTELVLSVIWITNGLLAVMSIVYYTLRNGISPMPSPKPAREAVLQWVARLTDIDTIVEAGSGWGSLALPLSRANPKRKVIALENSPLPYAVSTLRRLVGIAPNLRILRKDLYRFDYHAVDLVVCYLYPGAMVRLSGQLRRELKPGAWIISIGFALPHWQPELQHTCKDLYRTKLYLYQR